MTSKKADAVQIFNNPVNNYPMFNNQFYSNLQHNRYKLFYNIHRIKSNININLFKGLHNKVTIKSYGIQVILYD